MNMSLLAPLLLKLFRFTASLLARITSIDVKALYTTELLLQYEPSGTLTDEVQSLRSASQNRQDSEIFQLTQEIASLQSTDSITAFFKKNYLLRSRKPIENFGQDNENVRREWLQGVLENIPPGARLLDAGAGEQQYRRYCSHLEYVSQDFNQYDGLGDRSGLQTGKWSYGEIDIVSDICSIPISDHSFDVILCTEVFEHILTPLEAIKEFSRLLKKDGLLVLTVPFACLTHFSPHFYYTGFSKFFFHRILEEAGFCDVSISYNGSYFSYLAQELNRLPSIIEKYSETDNPRELQANIWLIETVLKDCAAKDSGSAELLAHGLHVTARRR